MKTDYGDFNVPPDHYKPKIVCIIPARGGSTRLPDKNMRMFAGRPLVSEAAARARDILTAHEVTPLPEDADRHIDEVIARWASRTA